MGVEKIGRYHNLEKALEFIKKSRAEARRDTDDLDKLEAMLRKIRGFLSAQQLQLNTDTENKITEMCVKIEEHLDEAHKSNEALYTMMMQLVADIRKKLRS